MQQQKRRRVFRAGLSVKDGEPIYLCRAIKSRVLHVDRRRHMVRATPIYGLPFAPSAAVYPLQWHATSSGTLEENRFTLVARTSL